jgi:hypothetical protein
LVPRCGGMNSEMIAPPHMLSLGVDLLRGSC